MCDRQAASGPKQSHLSRVMSSAHPALEKVVTLGRQEEIRFADCRCPVPWVCTPNRSYTRSIAQSMCGRLPLVHMLEKQAISRASRTNQKAYSLQA